MSDKNKPFSTDADSLEDVPENLGDVGAFKDEDNDENTTAFRRPELNKEMGDSSDVIDSHDFTPEDSCNRITK